MNYGSSESLNETGHYVYIIECRDGTLYTGYATDVLHRVQTHNAGKGAKYTRGRTPVRLLYAEAFQDKGEALRREWSIKRMSRQAKLHLTNQLTHGNEVGFT